MDKTRITIFRPTGSRGTAVEFLNGKKEGAQMQSRLYQPTKSSFRRLEYLLVHSRHVKHQFVTMSQDHLAVSYTYWRKPKNS